MALGLSPAQIVAKGEYQLLAKADYWERVFLKDVACVQNGFAFKSEFFDRDDGVPLIRIRDISKSNTEHRYNGDYDEQYVVGSGEILIGMDGDFLASKWKGDRALLNQRVCKLTVTSKHFDEQFFFLCLQPYLDAINAETSSVTVKHLSSKTVESIPLPLPPLNEQRRIVAKIEELLSELDKGIENLQAAREQLKTYRQSVLKYAFEGKLTALWREENEDKLETADQLLTRIRHEREACYQNQVKQWETATKKWELAGRTGKKPVKPRRLSETALPTEEELADFEDLPSGWMWVNLGNLVWSVKDGPHYSPKYVESGIPFITGGNIRPNGIDFSSAKFITPELHRELSERCKPEKGNLLYTKGGTTGIARVNTYDCDFNVWVHVAVLKITESLKPFYVQHALNSPKCYAQSQKYTHGVGNQDLGLTRMVNIVLPLCCEAEQEAIIQIFDQLTSELDSIEETINTELAKAQTLRQSILKSAFSGQLVEQDPNDEPASALLERIKTERAALPKVNRKNRNGKEAA